MTNEKEFFDTFCAVSRAFGTAATRDELLELIVQSAIDTMSAKAACLFLADEKQDTFIPVAQKGLSRNYLHASPAKAKSTISAILAEGYQAYPDVSDDPRLEHHALKKAEGIVSLLTVPVMVQDTAIGVLALYTGTRRDFSGAEIKFLTALAEQGGMAIEKARLMDRIYSNIALFLKLAATINSTLDIKEVFESLTVQVCEALGMKGAVIRLLDHKSNTLKIVASHGLSTEFLDKGYAPDTESAMRALKGETLAVPDVAADKRLRLQTEILKKENIQAMIITPITVRNKVIGTLRLYSAAARRFSPDMVALVKAIGHHGGMAIQNATMFLALQEDKRSLEEDIWCHRSWF